MQSPLCVGCVDGEALIEMNNLSVGYFPTKNIGLGVYPLPTVEIPVMQPAVLPVQVPVPAQDSGTSS